MRNLIYGILFFVLLTTSGCGSLSNSLSSVYNLANCKYQYNSVSDISISGFNVSEGISPLVLPQIMAILSGNASSIPLGLTLNIDVKNPNSGAAAFQALKYIVSIDDIQFTQGSLNQAFSVGAGETKRLPVNISTDIAELMKKNSGSAVENIVKNILGLSGNSSNVTVQLMPSFKVGEQTFTSPAYIPMSFTIGGNK